MALVVAGALIADGWLLLARRSKPADLAGLWELPGGKVESGETPEGALSRELREELGIETDVHERIGVEVTLGNDLFLRAYRVSLVSGEAAALDHSALDWVNSATILGKELVPADRVWLPDLVGLLTSSGPSSEPS